MTKKLNALIDDDRVRWLYHVLVDEDLSFTEWPRRQIDRYLSEKEQKQPGGKEVGRGEKRQGKIDFEGSGAGKKQRKNE